MSIQLGAPSLACGQPRTNGLGALAEDLEE
jgi:hypothetical protein